MEYNITVRIVVNDRNPHSPTLDDCVMAIENAIITPDNDHFGIEVVEVKSASDLESSILPSATEFQEVAKFAAEQMAQTIREDRGLVLKCLCIGGPTVECPIHGPELYETRR